MLKLPFEHAVLRRRRVVALFPVRVIAFPVAVQAVARAAQRRARPTGGLAGGFTFARFQAPSSFGARSLSESVLARSPTHFLVNGNELFASVCGRERCSVREEPKKERGWRVRKSAVFQWRARVLW